MSILPIILKAAAEFDKLPDNVKAALKLTTTEDLKRKTS